MHSSLFLSMFLCTGFFKNECAPTRPTCRFGKSKCLCNFIATILQQKARNSDCSKGVAGALKAAGWLEKEMPRILTRYQPSEVYDADETRFCCYIKCCHSTKRYRCHGGKQSALRIAVLCINMMPVTGGCRCRCSDGSFYFCEVAPTKCYHFKY